MDSLVLNRIMVYPAREKMEQLCRFFLKENEAAKKVTLLVNLDRYCTKSSGAVRKPL